VVEVTFAHDKVVADTGKWDDIDPRGVIAGLLEGGWDKTWGDVGIEGVYGRVVETGLSDGAHGGVIRYGVEGMLVGE
jgi:hypothetical protein